MRITSTNLLAMVGCHRDMVTMATIYGNFFFILLSELRLTFVNSILGINIFQLDCSMFMKISYHGNREDTSYSYVSQHNKLKFGIRV